MVPVRVAQYWIATNLQFFFLLFLDISLARFMSLLGPLAIFQNTPGDSFANHFAVNNLQSSPPCIH